MKKENEKAATVAPSGPVSTLREQSKWRAKQSSKEVTTNTTHFIIVNAIAAQSKEQQEEEELIRARMC